MFEDSTFESNGTIRTRSRGWMIAALALNSSIVFALILIPLIYPEALTGQFMPFLIEVPPPASAAPTPPHPAIHAASGPSVAYEDPLAPPRQISPTIFMVDRSEGTLDNSLIALDSGDRAIVGIPGGLGNRRAPPVVRLEPKTTAHLPSSVAAGLLIRKVVPPYPPIAKASHTEGTVVVAATISKDGAIINLRVVSGPPMLQQAALDAVSQWRYRPYLLNSQPVDVETTVNVIFTLGG